MPEIDDLVSRVAGKARSQRELPSPVTAGQLRRAEDLLGFSLPPLLAALYREVANGGFGPGADVPIPGYHAALVYPLDRAVEVYHDNRVPDPHTPDRPWPDRVFPFLYWGDFAEAGIDCRTANGMVLMYESDVEQVAPDQAWKIQSLSLAAWCESWLAGDLPVATQVWRP